MSEPGRVGEEGGGGGDLVKLSTDLLEGHVGLVETFCRKSIHGDRSRCCIRDITRFDILVEKTPPPHPSFESTNDLFREPESYSQLNR
jgi:hypothetical protein